MKKLNLVILAIALLTGYIALSGYKDGPALNHGYDCTGAETGLGNRQGCGAFVGCHSTSATTGIALTVELDSAGVPLTQYVAGNSYTIKITGVNNTSNNLPKFGFQVSAILGTTTEVTPTNAGSFPAPYPTNTHLSAPHAGDYVTNIVEHSTPLNPTTGTGATGSTYVENINWTAPLGWTGEISIWAALNAVDNNDTNDVGDLWNVNHIVITQGPAGINEIIDNTDVKVYPNPCSGVFTIQTKNEQLTTKSFIEIYNLLGEKVHSEFRIQSRALGTEFNINLGVVPAGIYVYRIISENSPAVTGKIIVE